MQKKKPAKKLKPSEPESSPDMVEKGRMYGRYIDMFGLIKPVLEHGMARDENASDTFYTAE